MKTPGRCILLLLLPAAAAAQDAIQIFGIVDISLLRGQGSLSRRVQLAPGGLDLPRIGISGSEDLGGGHKALFWLEADLQPDSGRGNFTNLNNQPLVGFTPLVGGQGLTFNRLLFVGVQAPWGIVRVGRDYTPTFAVHALYDPAGAGGLVGTQSTYGSLTLPTPLGVRASNSLAIAIGELRRGPLLHAQYVPGENLSDSGPTRHDGGYRGVRLAYTVSPIDVAFGHGVYKFSAMGDLRETIVGGKFDVGRAVLWTSHVRNTTGKANSMRGSMLGVSYPSGPWHWKASVSRSAQRNVAGDPVGTTVKLGFGVSYALSKRTAVYLHAARTHNSHGATQMPTGGIGETAPNQRGAAQDLGLRHSF